MWDTGALLPTCNIVWALQLTSVLPADILQVEVWITGHVFLHPGPTVDLLVCRRDDEEAAEGAKMSVILNGQLHVCSITAQVLLTCSC